MRTPLLLFVYILAFLLCGNNIIQTIRLTDATAVTSSLWNDCADTEIDMSIPSTGGTYESVNCTFVKGFRSLTTHTLSSGFHLNVVISNGIVKGGDDASSGLGIVFLSDTSVPTSMQGAMDIKIQNMKFETNAVLKVEGALPPRSSLWVTNNSFAITKMNSHITLEAYSTRELLPAICLGNMGDVFVLTDNANLIVKDNFMKSNAVGSSAAVLVFLAPKQFVVARGSHLLVEGNVVSDSVGDAVYSVHWFPGDLSGDLALIVFHNSSVSLSHNQVTNTGVDGPLHVVRFDANVLSINVSVSSIFALCNNTISGYRRLMAVSSPISAVYWLILQANIMIAVTSASNMIVNHNQLANVVARSVVYAVYFSAFGIDVLITKSSQLSFSNNTAANVEIISTSIHGVYLYATDAPMLLIARDDSNISLSHNTVQYAICNLVTYSLLLFSDGNGGFITINADNHSSISMDENSIAQSTIANHARAVSLMSERNDIRLIATNRSFLSWSNNSAKNVSLSSIYTVYVLEWRTPTSLEVALSVNAMLAVNGNVIINGSALEAIAVYIVIPGRLRFLVINGSNATFSKDNIYQTKGDRGCTVYLVTSELTLIVAGFSNFSMDNNAISNTMFGANSITGLLWSAGKDLTVSVLDKSRFSLDRNVVANSTSLGSAYTLRVTSPRMLWHVSNISTLSISNNSLSNVTSTDTIATITMTSTTNMTIRCENKSHYTVNDNTLLNGTTVGVRSGAMFVLSISALTALIASTDQSVTTFSANSIKYSGSGLTDSICVVRWLLSNALSASFVSAGRSAINMSDNIVKKSEADQIYTVQIVGKLNAYPITFNATANSEISLSGNLIKNGLKVATAVSVSIESSHSISLVSQKQSMISMKNNRATRINVSLTSSNLTCAVALKSSTAGTSIIANATSSISLSNNAVTNVGSLTNNIASVYTVNHVTDGRLFLFVTDHSVIEMKGNLLEMVRCNRISVLNWQSQLSTIIIITVSSNWNIHDNAVHSSVASAALNVIHINSASTDGFVLNISQSSIFSTKGTQMTDCTLMGTDWVTTLYIPNLITLFLSDNSFFITRDIHVINVSARQFACVRLLSSQSLTLQQNASMSVTNNTVIASDINSSIEMIQLLIAQLVLMNNSVFSIDQNFLQQKNSSRVISVDVFALVYLSNAIIDATLILGTDCTLELKDNTVIMDVGTSTSQGYIFYNALLTKLLDIGAALSVLNNSANFIASHASSATSAIILFPKAVHLNATNVTINVVDNSFTTERTLGTDLCPHLILSFQIVQGSTETYIDFSRNKIGMHTGLSTGLRSNCPFLRLGVFTSQLSVNMNKLVCSTISYMYVKNLTVPAEGKIFVGGNTISLVGSFSSASDGYFIFIDSLVLANRSGLYLESNSVMDTVLSLNYKLLISQWLTNLSSVSVFACGNTLFGQKILIPMSLLSQNFEGAVSKCDTTIFSISQSLLMSKTDTTFTSFTRTTPLSLSPVPVSSDSLSLAATNSLGSRNASSTHNPQATPSITPSVAIVPLMSASNTQSIFRSATPSPNISDTISITNSVSFSESATLTCKDINDLSPSDTCAVLRPLPSEVAASIIPVNDTSVRLNSNWLLENNNCTSIYIPFSVWRGRAGTTHEIAIAAIDPRVPMKTTLEPPVVDGNDGIALVSLSSFLLPVTLQFASQTELDNATIKGVVPATASTSINTPLEAAIKYPVMLAVFRYEGKATLNKVQYKVQCMSLTRCPIAMVAEMDITLLASTRIFPVGATEFVNIGTNVISVGSGLTVSPTAVAQLNVVMSLQKMSRCSTVDLDDQRDTTTYVEYTSGTMNPFGIKILGGEGRAYLRGTLIMSFIYLFTLSMVMLLLTTVSSRLVFFLSSHATNSKRRRVVPPPLFGYPSALVAVISFAVDPAASAGTVLGLQGEGWGDKGVGWLAVALCCLFVGHIVYSTIIQFPRSSIMSELLTNNTEQNVDPLGIKLAESAQSTDSENEQNKSSRSKRSWFLAPTHKWKVVDVKGARWMARNESYIADVRLAWYCAIEQGVALIVCVLGGISFGEATYCIARGIVCVLILGAQAAIMIVLHPPVHRWRWLLMSVVLTLQTLTAALSVVNAPLQDQQIELGMDIITTLIFILLTIATVSDFVLMIAEGYASARHAMISISKLYFRKGETQNSQRNSRRTSPLLTSDLPDGASLELVSLAMDTEVFADEEREAAVVRGILDDFAQFELSEGFSTK